MGVQTVVLSEVQLSKLKSTDTLLHTLTSVAATPTQGLAMVFKHFSCTRKLHTKMEIKFDELLNKV